MGFPNRVPPKTVPPLLPMIFARHGTCESGSRSKVERGDANDVTVRRSESTATQRVTDKVRRNQESRLTSSGGFSTATIATAFAGHLRARYGPSLPLRIIENAGQAASLAFGLPFSNYTGVLIGAIAIPVWNRNVGNLPFHFGASGLGAAIGLLELLGHRKSRALQAGFRRSDL
jgi:hypothetical protein